MIDVHWRRVGNYMIDVYWRRLCSLLIDVLLGALFLIPIWPISLLLMEAVRGRNDRTGAIIVAVVAIVVASVACVGFVIWNSGYRQGTTGQSIGKKVFGIKLVGAATGQPVGFWLAIGRLFAHLLDVVTYLIGFLWPLWDKQRQTLADKVCFTLVVRADA